MNIQSEYELEQDLVKQLSTELGYTKVKITNEQELYANLRTQLAKHNKIELTDNEFKKILNHLQVFFLRLLPHCS